MRQRYSLSAILLLVWVLAACGAPPAPTPTPTATATEAATATPPPVTATVGAVPEIVREPAAQGRLRVVQAAPQSGAVDVYLEQALLASRLGLGAFTNPIPVESGTYFLQVVPAGALPDTQILAETVLEIPPQASLLVLIAGTAETLNVSVIPETLSPLPAGQSRVAFIHAVPRGPTFTPTVNGQPLGDPLDFGQASPPHLLTAGAYNLAFTNDDAVLADIQAVLAPQQQYTAVLVGQVGGGDYRALLFNTPVEVPGHVRFIHAGYETPALDVYVEGQLLASNLPYRTASEWATFSPGTYSVRIMESEAGPEAQPLAEARFSLSANQALHILLFEEWGEPALRIFASSLDPTPPLTARLVVVNAAPGIRAVSAQTGDAPLTEIPMIPYGMATRMIDFPSGLVNLLWVSQTGEDTQLVERVGDYTFAEGHAYTYVVTGSEQEPFVLVDEVGTDSALTAAFSDQPGAGARNVAQLRVINAMADPVAAQVRLDDTLLVGALPPGQVSDYTTLRQDQYTLRVEAADGPPGTRAFYEQALSLLTTSRASLILYGTTDAVAVSLVPDYENPIQAGQAILRLFHAAPGYSPLAASIEIPGLDPTGEPAGGAEGAEATAEVTEEAPAGPYRPYETAAFGPGQASGFIGLPQGTYDVRVLDTTNSQVVALAPRLALDGRTAYLLLLLPGADADRLESQLLALPPAP